MNQVKIKKKNTETIISYKLRKNEQISKVAMDILSRGEIPALLPLKINSGLTGNYFKTVISDMIRLSDYLGSHISFGTFIDIAEQTVRIIQECEARGILTGNLELNVENVFFHYTGYRVRMLYWPTISVMDYTNVADFFIVLGNTYVADPVDMQYRSRYLEYLNKRAEFDILKFWEYLKSLRRMWMADNCSDSSPKIISVIPRKDKVGGYYGLGKKRPYLIRVKDNNKIVMDKFPFIIGRSSQTCDYVINDNACIGRKHVTFIKKGEMIYIQDNGSINQTRLNGRLLEPGIDVMISESECVIKIADEEFLYYLEDR